MEQLLIDFQKYLDLPGVDNMKSDSIRAKKFIELKNNLLLIKYIRHENKI